VVTSDALPPLIDATSVAPNAIANTRAGCGTGKDRLGRAKAMHAILRTRPIRAIAGPKYTPSPTQFVGEGGGGFDAG
jgi:hypothetical protein